MIEELGDIKSHGGSRNDPEIRQGRVSAANCRVAIEDIAELVALSFLLQLGAGIGNRDETAAGFFLADGLLNALQEMLLENVRLERRARFARYDEEWLLQIDCLFKRLHLRRIGRIQYMRPRKPFNVAVGLLQNF